MPRALVRLSWKPSPSANIVKVVAYITINGNEIQVEVDPAQTSYDIQISASSQVNYSLKVWNADGLTADSVNCAFNIGSLERPLPPTDLTHEIVSVLPDVLVNPSSKK